MPDFAASDTAATAGGAYDHSLAEGRSRPTRGHIGLIVLSSIAVGLGLGLVLDLLVFGGGREPVITGAALLSLAIGFAMLAELSARRTNQPQDWARVPAISFGVAGAAILILRPSTHVLGLLGWVWPIILMVLVVWMFRRSRRSLQSWSRRVLLYPAFAALPLVALAGHSRPSQKRRRATGRRPVAAPTSWLAIASTCAAWARGLPLSSCSTASGSERRVGLGCKETSPARPASVPSIARAKGGVERVSGNRTRISCPRMCEAFLRLRMFRARTCSPVTRLGAPTHSLTRWSTRRTWLGSR